MRSRAEGPEQAGAFGRYRAGNTSNIAAHLQKKHGLGKKDIEEEDGLVRACEWTEDALAGAARTVYKHGLNMVHI